MDSQCKTAVSTVLGLAAAALAGGSAYLASYTVHGNRMTLDESLDWQKEHYDVEWFFKLAREDYTVASFDGYVLHAQLCRALEPSDKYVILTHGYTDNRMGTLKYMKLYLDRGYNCVIYDLRGHGVNKEAICTYSIREGKDLYEMIRDTFRRYPDLKVLGLHGESLGAATTAAAMGYGMWAKADGLRKADGTSQTVGAAADADMQKTTEAQKPDADMQKATGAQDPDAGMEKTAGTKKKGTSGTKANARRETGSQGKRKEASPDLPVNFAVCDCGFADIENVLDGAAQGMLDQAGSKTGGEKGKFPGGEHLKHPTALAKFMVRCASAASAVCYGYSFGSMKPISYLEGNRVPMLFMHGEADTFILPENSRRMAAATAGYSEYHLIPGANHAESVLVEPELYRKYLYGFLDHVGC